MASRRIWGILEWRDEFKPELRAERYSRLTCEIERVDSAFKLILGNEIEREIQNLSRTSRSDGRLYFRA